MEQFGVADPCSEAYRVAYVVMRDGKSLYWMNRDRRGQSMILTPTDLVGIDAERSIHVQLLRRSCLPISSGWIHVKGNDAFIEGLEEVYIDEPRIRRFELFSTTNFYEGDVLEFCIGEYLEECFKSAWEQIAPRPTRSQPVGFI